MQLLEHNFFRNEFRVLVLTYLSNCDTFQVLEQMKLKEVNESYNYFSSKAEQPIISGVQLARTHLLIQSLNLFHSPRNNCGFRKDMTRSLPLFQNVYPNGTYQFTTAASVFQSILSNSPQFSNAARAMIHAQESIYQHSSISLVCRGSCAQIDH